MHWSFTFNQLPFPYYILIHRPPPPYLHTGGHVGVRAPHVPNYTFFQETCSSKCNKTRLVFPTTPSTHSKEFSKTSMTTPTWSLGYCTPMISPLCITNSNSFLLGPTQVSGRQADGPRSSRTSGDHQRERAENDRRSRDRHQVRLQRRKTCSRGKTTTGSLEFV